MSTSTIYLITGANKGIGRAIITDLLLRPNTTVVAGVRYPEDPTSASLRTLPTADGSRLVLLPLLTDADFASLGDTLLASHKIAHLDIAVANAGNTSGFKSILDVTTEDVLFDFEANTLGSLKLFKACWPLLEKSSDKSGKKFVFMTSYLGSIGAMDEEPIINTAYGMSKASLNFLGKKASLEFKDKGLVVGLLHPGWVKTKMGQALADSLGLKEPPMKLDDCATKCIEQIDGLTMEKSGKFLRFDGGEIPW